MKETHELSRGDATMVAELKAMLAKGVSAKSARRRLIESGYSDYHADFLLGVATGRKATNLTAAELELDRVEKVEKERVYLGIVIALGIVVGVLAALRFNLFW